MKFGKNHRNITLFFKFCTVVILKDIKISWISKFKKKIIKIYLSIAF